MQLCISEKIDSNDRCFREDPRADCIESRELVELMYSYVLTFFPPYRFLSHYTYYILR